MTVAQLIAGARAYAEEGYRAVKLRVGARPPEEDLARVRAVREAVGDSLRLLVDCNERLDFATALWLGARLEGLGVYWLEEPLPAHDLQGHATLARQLRVAIAAGEHLQGRFEFAAYVEERAASVLMPDAGHRGRRVGVAADRRTGGRCQPGGEPPLPARAAHPPGRCGKKLPVRGALPTP